MKPNENTPQKGIGLQGAFFMLAILNLAGFAAVLFMFRPLWQDINAVLSQAAGMTAVSWMQYFFWGALVVFGGIGFNIFRSSPSTCARIRRSC